MWHVNPDGQELLANWYMQEQDLSKRNMLIPKLYQKYVGHDNNRDYFMNNMKETENLSQVMYVDWLPQIVYNHHQTSPAGTVVAGPPYRDPFNHVFDPLIITSLDGVAASMINRLNVEDKPGYTRLSGSVFSTWWNGGLRTTPYFHNMIGILTEITGNPTPMQIPIVADRLLPNNATPNPVMPQKWHFRQSIDYSVSLNFAILDYAARNGDQLLYNFYKMGKNAIDRGNRDHWTLYPKYVDQFKKLSESTDKASAFQAVYQNPDHRDARGYILSADQADFGTAIKFANALIKSGISAYVAKSEFQVEGRTYPAESIVIKANQAFRPHLMDMFEAQDHPHDVAYEGGPPVRPYDAAGWTLALQMGLKFDRIYSDIPTTALKRNAYGQLLEAPTKKIPASKTGYLISAAANDAFLVVNKLIKAGIAVYRITDASQGLPAGSFYMDSKAYQLLSEVVPGTGIQVVAAQKKPAHSLKLAPLRIGLYDYYGGSMPSGWTRWILEKFNFEYALFYPKDINNKEILKKYDVLLFIGPGIPDPQVASRFSSRLPSAELVPEPYHYLLDSLTQKQSIPVLKEFVDNGGKIVTVGSSSSFVYYLDLPIENPLLEKGKSNKLQMISSAKFYIPTSILAAQVSADTHTWGMPAEIPVVYNNSPVFKIQGNIKPLLTFNSSSPLLSGWANGQDLLKGTVSALATDYGKGQVIAFGPEITNRAQAHGTFKLLFNQLYEMK